MRVVCVKFLDPVSGEERSEGSWLTLDREYVVLAVDVEADRRVWFRIQSEEAATPALFDAGMFLTTSTEIPGSWRVRVDEGGSRLAPEPWLRPGFWDEFFDRVPGAVEVYEKERALILADEE